MVECDLEDDAVVVDLRLRGRPRCSGCGKKRPIYDRRPSREWRDLDMLGYQCVLRAELRRVSCWRCGGIRIEQVSWAAPDSDFTLRFEDQVTWLAQHCDKTTIQQLMRIAWRTVGAIIERCVAHRRAPVDWSKVRAIGIDELAYRKGNRYLTIVTDLESGRMIKCAEGRSAETLARIFAEMGPEACARIRYVTIDMSAAYAKGVRDHLPNAEIVYDRFHVLRLLSDAVDQTRREEWRAHQNTPEGEAIKHTRYALLKSPWNLTAGQEEQLAQLQRRNRPIYRGYLLKESFAQIYRDLAHPASAMRRITSWLAWAARSRLAAFVDVGRTIKKHLDGILAFFTTGFTNGLNEGLNNKARLATRQAYGFHSPTAALAMIELRCSGLRIPLPH